MSWAAAIPAVLGLISQTGVLGKKAKEGKKIEYETQAPAHQQEFSKQFFDYLQGQIGKGATPYGGQVAAPFQNPFTQGAFGAMKASPYGSMMGNQPMGGMPFIPPQQQGPPQQIQPRRKPLPPQQIDPNPGGFGGGTGLDPLGFGSDWSSRGRQLIYPS